MNTLHRYHPRFDRLEDRTCPALSAHQFGGLLIISGVPNSGTVSVHETGSNTFTVADGSVHASFAGVTNLTVALGRGNDSVDVNLGGNTFAGTVSVAFAGGANALSIEHGIVGFLNIQGGGGSNAIVLGDGSTLLRVMHDTVATLAGNAADTFTMASNVAIVGSLTVTNAATVALDSGSAIGHSANFFAARTGTLVADAAIVLLDVNYFGNFAVASGQDSLEVDGAVGRNVVFSSALLNTVGDEVDINANVGNTVAIASGGVSDRVNVTSGVIIGGNLSVALVRGSDTINVEDGSIIDGGALLQLGNGTRQVAFGARVGNNTSALVFAITGGVGNENVTFTAGATFLGTASVSLSTFSMNTVSFTSAKTFNRFLFVIDGGAGGFNTLNLNGTRGAGLFFRHFAIVNP